MKKLFLFLLLFMGIQSLLFSNPIDTSPETLITELIFDNDSSWTIELFIPYGYQADLADSIIIETSNSSAKLKNLFQNRIGIINSDSLSAPLPINRNGDKITIYTHSANMESLDIIREDYLIFGNFPGTTVGAPIDGYSIYRCQTTLPSGIPLMIESLTKKSSPGVENSISEICGTMKGFVYDKNNKLVFTNVTPHYGEAVFLIDLPLEFNTDGSYTTKIFHKFLSPKQLKINLMGFGFFSDTIGIEPFELNNIHPDTVVIQDIHLSGHCKYCTLVGIDKTEISAVNEFTLINYPNPFNGSTNFFIKMPDANKLKQKDLEIYNITGQLIKKIPLEGKTRTSWNGTDSHGAMVSSGVYYYKLNIDNQIMKSGSMILLK